MVGALLNIGYHITEEELIRGKMWLFLQDYWSLQARPGGSQVKICGLPKH